MPFPTPQKIKTSLLQSSPYSQNNTQYTANSEPLLCSIQRAPMWQRCFYQYHAVLILHHPTCTQFSAHTLKTKTHKARFHSFSCLQIHSLRQTHTGWKRERRVVLTDVCLLTFAAFLANQPISYSRALCETHWNYLSISPIFVVFLLILFFHVCFFSLRLTFLSSKNTVSVGVCVCVDKYNSSLACGLSETSVFLLTQKMTMPCGFPEHTMCECA